MFTSEHEDPSKRAGCFIWGKYLHRVKYNKYITCNIYHKHFNVTKSNIFIIKYNK